MSPPHSAPAVPPSDALTSSSCSSTAVVCRVSWFLPQVGLKQGGLPMHKLLLLLCLVLMSRPGALGQGLRPNKDTVLGASAQYRTLKNLYGRTRSFLTSYKLGSRANACASKQGSLCAAGISDEEQTVLLMATSPQSYHSGESRELSAVGPVRNQKRCSSCLAFAVTAAAESAMATALQQQARGALSEHDFYFCKGIRPGFQGSCEEAFSLQESVSRWIDLHNSKNYITTTECLPYDPDKEPLCQSRPSCNPDFPEITKGSFRAVTLRTIPSMQQHIRNHGSIVCPINIYSDFRDVFAKSRDGVYKGPGWFSRAAYKAAKHRLTARCLCQISCLLICLVWYSCFIVLAPPLTCSWDGYHTDHAVQMLTSISVAYTVISTCYWCPAIVIQIVANKA